LKLLENSKRHGGQQASRRTEGVAPPATATTSQKKANGFDALNTSYCGSCRTDRK